MNNSVVEHSIQQLSKFLQAMQQQYHLVRVKELTKGVESIVDVDWKNPECVKLWLTPMELFVNIWICLPAFPQYFIKTSQAAFFHRSSRDRCWGCTLAWWKQCGNSILPSWDHNSVLGLGSSRAYFPGCQQEVRVWPVWPTFPNGIKSIPERVPCSPLTINHSVLKHHLRPPSFASSLTSWLSCQMSLKEALLL